MKTTGLLALLIFFNQMMFSQISEKTLPFSSKRNLSVQIPHVVLQAPNMDLIAEHDRIEAEEGKLPKAGTILTAGFSLDNSGAWTELENGDRIWRLQISSSGALSVNPYLENVFIPRGAKLHVYNSDKSQVLGAYTVKNNQNSGQLAIELVYGDHMILEYYEPAQVKGMGRLNVAEVGYGYRMIENPYKRQRDFGDSEACQININCSPEGDDWQDEKKSAARIQVKDGAFFGWCTGGVVNNTNGDCAPYFLTAFHCGETASTSDLGQWIFYFNYEASGCSNPAGSPSWNTMAGCTKLAASNDGGGSTGSDFMLLEFSGSIPQNYDVYYAGWNNSGNMSSSGVSIHHPSGDIKKISTYSSNTLSSTWGSAAGSHWSVLWAATTNGHGVTEGGSSGSLLFDDAGHVVGTLTGGGSFCASPTSRDYYGKFSYHWSNNGTTSAERLSDWLDPTGSGVSTLDGTYYPCTGGGTSLNAEFSASTTTVLVGGSVDFTDMSTGSPTTWTWAFSGGTPTSSTTQNQSGVIYNTVGTYDVSLTVGDGTNTDTETKTSYVTVTDGTAPTCDTVNFPVPGTPTLYGSNNGGYVAGTNGYMDKAKADIFDNTAPYTMITGVIVGFGAAYGTGTCTLAIWDDNSGTPGNIIHSETLQISDIITDVNNSAYTAVEFANSLIIPGTFYAGIILPTTTTDSIGLITNTDGDSNPGTAWEMWSDDSWYAYSDASAWGLNLSHAIHPVVCQGWPISIDEISSGSIRIFPNPGKGQFNVLLNNSISESMTYEVYTITGELVFQDKITSAGSNVISIDLSHLNSGFYLIKGGDSNQNWVEKIHLIKD